MANRATGDVPAMLARLLLAGVCALLIAAAAVAPGAEVPPAFSAAQAIAAGGGAPEGLFIPAGGELWLQPLAVYPAATMLRAGLPTGWALLMPGLAAGVCAIVFTYLLGARVAGRRGGLVAAVLLASAPGFLSSMRIGDGTVLMVPLVLGWTLSLMVYLERRRALWLLIGACALGLSVYTQPAGVIAVPVYFVLGAVALWRAGESRALAASAVAMSLMLLPAAIWFWQFSETYRDTFGRWLIHAAHVRSPLDGAIAATRWHVIARRVSVYWDYFSPTFLFVSGQVFAFGMLVLIGLGLWKGDAASRVDERLIIAGFVLAPAAAVLLDVERAAALALMFLPFGAVLAALGVQAALGARSGALRAIALGLLVLTVLWPGAALMRLAG